MAKDNGLQLIVSLFILGGGSLYKGLSDFRKKRKIQDTARIDIGSAPQGLVEVEGYAWPVKNPLVAVCGRRTVYYNYQVQKYVKRGKNSSWETQYIFEHIVPFFLADSSGLCLIYPTAKNMNVREEITRLHAYAEDIPGLIRATQLQNNAGFFGKLFSNSYRLVEKKILVGSPVYVCGDMQTINRKEINVPGDISKFLSEVKDLKVNTVHKMLRFDKNKDGSLSDRERSHGYSSIARKHYHDGIQKAKLAGTVTDTQTHKMIVADCHQEHLLRRLERNNTLMIIGGVAMLSLGFYLVSFRL